MSFFKYLLPFIFVFFTGCSTRAVNNTNGYHEEVTDFKFLTSKLLPNSFCNKINSNTTLYVTDFVNESNLDNKSELGFLLSNELKVNILKNGCTKNVAIKTFNLGSSLKIGQNGAKILTRDLQQLKTQNIEDDKQMAVGSYIITNKQIILFLKLINLQNGDTIVSSSSSSPLTSEIKELEGMKNVDDSPYIRKPFHL
ncbi:MAG: FlgO family outer membrane protein [Arcobacteraceae bacterium]|jgi:hypothetical protein|nr:FlgO family outer membrane protein [Arcobacteraceae bacterium]